MGLLSVCAIFAYLSPCGRLTITQFSAVERGVHPAI
jgi:hypothetical protein